MIWLWWRKAIAHNARTYSDYMLLGGFLAIFSELGFTCCSKRLHKSNRFLLSLEFPRVGTVFNVTFRYSDNASDKGKSFWVLQ